MTIYFFHYESLRRLCVITRVGLLRAYSSTATQNRISSYSDKVSRHRILAHFTDLAHIN